MKKFFLKGNILCALPQLKDIFFSKSLIYLTHHSKEGAVGIILIWIVDGGVFNLHIIASVGTYRHIPSPHNTA